MHPIVSSIHYEVKNIDIGDARNKIYSFFTNTADKFIIKMYEKEDKDLWLNFIMQAMEQDVLMNSLGLPAEPGSMLCLREWIEILLDIDLAIGCFKQSENKQTLVAVDILFERTIHDTVPNTRQSYGQGYRPFQNYLKLIYLGHRRYWNKTKNNKKINFLTSIGLIVDPVYRDTEIEHEMLRKRHLVTGCAKIQELMTLFVGRISGDLKDKYKLLYKLDKNETSHDINFLNDDAFEILFVTRTITKADMSAMKGVRNNTKRISRVRSASIISEPPESPNSVFLTPESQQFRNSRESSRSAAIYEPNDDIKIELDSDSD